MHSESSLRNGSRNQNGTFAAKAVAAGERYGKLTIVSRLERRGHNWIWKCVCECGTAVDVAASNLRSGNSKSCGCHRVEVSKAKATKHGMSGTNAYSLWQNMMRRCYDEGVPAYKDYGERGITVCVRWHDFENFYADMGDRPLGLSLDRKNNGAGYSPDNCRWATGKEQMRNMRTNVLATVDGKTTTIAELAESSGHPYARLLARKQVLGWADSALLRPKRGA